MSSIGVPRAVCGQLLDVIAVAVEPEADPAAFCCQLAELLQDAIGMGVLQGRAAARAERSF